MFTGVRSGESGTSLESTPPSSLTTTSASSTVCGVVVLVVRGTPLSRESIRAETPALSGFRSRTISSCDLASSLRPTESYARAKK